MNQPRVLLLSEPYPPRNPGGAGKFARTLAQGLTVRGYTVDVVCIDPEIDETLIDGKVQVHRVKVVERGWKLEAFDELYGAILTVIESLHKHKPYDLLHDVGGFLYANVFRTFTLSSGIPSITHLLMLMGPYLTAAEIPTRFVQLFHNLQQLQCGVSKVVITTSSAEQLIYRKSFKIVPLDHLVSNGIDFIPPIEERVQHWRKVLAPDGAMLLFVGGRLGDRVKGNDRAVALINALQKRRLNARLVGTNLRIDDSDHSINNTVTDSIHSVGRLTDEELPSLLAAADVVLCPSRYEAFGLLAIEALAAGTPVMASDTGGYLDTVGRVANGLLLRDEDWQNPNEQIVDFLRRCSAEWTFPRSNLTLPEQFTIEGVVNRIDVLYKQILAD